MLPANNKVIIFDTTMRDGELTPGVKMNVRDKISIAQILDEMGVDIIEVGYPGRYEKDFDELVEISHIVKNATICGLASSKQDEIMSVAEAIKSAKKGRIHIYTPITLSESQVLAAIKESVALARNYCDDVEWSAFDASRSSPDFLCKSIEIAINSGATTINIPDSLGCLLPE